MILNISPKSITLLLAVSATCTTASNLRQRQTALFSQHGHSEASLAVAAEQYVRSPAAPAASASESTAVEDTSVASTATTAEPSITLDKSTYAESESIAVTFSVGSPSHPYYSSSDAPSLNLDYNYPEWSVGLFMRDADPQGGTLSPIVSVNVCGAMEEGCDADDRSFATYNDLGLTFGSEYLDLMQGVWPLEVSRYGTGFDAYVLDGKGAAAIGPLSFYIQSEYDDDDVDEGTNGPVEYRPVSKSSSVAKPSTNSAINNAASNPLLKYHKGTKKSTERQHATASKSSATAQANVKIASANGLEMSRNTIPSEPSFQKTAGVAAAESTTGPSIRSISSNKEEYEDDEPVSISFSFPADEDLSNYKIGIFMRMANPQGGALPPIVSMPVCSGEGSSECNMSGDLTVGSVTFSQENMEHMMPEGAGWPMDLYQWGTGFDVYVLDESGDDVTGPVKFNIMMDDTY
mmetsp:Transcript_19580/g.41931  ORF Transcript_19580/g.41931 Transcript_19580/m.41931 type:complete len:462 (+) Transcript_19580:226-1611(+)